MLTDNSELKKYGLGIYLYLELLKQLGFFFLFAAIIGCIQMVHNYQEDGLSSYPSSFSLSLVKTTLGNVVTSSQSLVLMHTIISGICNFIFFIFVLHWIRFSNSTVT